VKWGVLIVIRKIRLRNLDLEEQIRTSRFLLFCESRLDELCLCIEQVPPILLITRPNLPGRLDISQVRCYYLLGSSVNASVTIVLVREIVVLSRTVLKDER
jgi:hypothetical protein